MYKRQVLHLTRPPVIIPNREAIDIASHLDAAKGAYIIKNYDEDSPKEGVVFVRGTSSTNSIMQILPRLRTEGPNVKIIASISWELYIRQSEEYRNSIISESEWHDAMIITNGARRLMHKWIANRLVEKYSMAPDFDNRWRTGGSLEQIIAESKLDPDSLWEGITRFAKDRKYRLDKLRKVIPE